MAKRTFNLQELRGHLLASYGVSMLLKKSRSDANVTTWSMSCISHAVQAALCGLDAEALALCERAREWLAVETKTSQPGYQHHLGFAIANWILTGRLDQAALEDACQYLREYLTSVRDKTEVAHQLSPFLLAEKYTDLCQIFEATKSLKPAENLNRIRCPGKMSYVIASHEVSGEPGLPALKDAFQSYLKFQIPVCLHVHRSSLGTWGDVPAWMLLHGRYLQEVPLTGVEALRVALDYVAVSDVA